MRYNIIKTDSYLLICDDSEIKVGDWFINLISKELLICFKNSAVKSLGGKTINNTEKWLDNNDCKKIIAYRPLNGAPYLDGVDLLPPIEDEVEDFANEEYELQQKSFEESLEMFPFNDSMLLKSGFISGYNKAREKYKFTEEDVRQAYVFGRSMMSPNNFKKYLQSLCEPKLPIGFECEMEFNGVNHAQGLQPTGHPLMDVAIMENYKLKTLTNSEGRVELVGKYIYE